MRGNISCYDDVIMNLSYLLDDISKSETAPVTKKAKVELGKNIVKSEVNEQVKMPGMAPEIYYGE